MKIPDFKDENEITAFVEEHDGFELLDKGLAKIVETSVFKRRQENNSTENQTGYLINRIETLKKELVLLKSFVKKREQKKVTKLEGLWKGVEITEADIEEAKKTVFKQAYEFEE